MYRVHLLLPGVLVLSITASCDQRPAASSCVDADGDGFGTDCAAGPDCNDDDATVHPGAAELDCADPKDHDCDGLSAADHDTDGDGVTDCLDCAPDGPSLFATTPAYTDADGDGYGVGELVEVCAGDALPAGYASVAGDCDDDDPASYPHDDGCLRVRWAHVYAAALHTCALDEAGTAYCWGSNRYGQLGVGRIGGVHTSPVPVDVSALGVGTTFVRLALGSQHTCALDGAGVAYCWGSNAAGAVGQPTPEAIAPAPVRIDPSAFGGEALVDIAAGSELTCAATASGRVYCWGDNSHGGLGVDGPHEAATPIEAAVPLTTTVAHVVAGPAQVCSLGSEGDEYCWGSHASYITGTPLPAFVRNAPGLIVSPGNGYQCVITTDGVASCSGDGTDGVLGAGPDVLQTVEEVPVLTDAIPGFTGFASITAGGGVTCALTREADAYCWGMGELGALGTGAVRDSAWSPVAVDASGLAAGERWVELAAGNAHVCGITSTGALRCWGSDGWDQLGDGGEPSSSAVGRPVDASALGPGELVAQVSAGTNHACELTTLGRVLCWGRNAQGRLGIGEAGPTSATPLPIDTTAITGDTRFVEISAGNNHSCAVAADGAAYCWGNDEYGQLGDDGSFVDRAAPVAVDRGVVSGDGKLVRIVAGYNDTCAIASDGSAYCWGARVVPGTAIVATPVRIDVAGLGGDARFVQIDAGWGGCGTTADGRGVCWSPYLGLSAPTAIDLTAVTGSTTVVEMTTAWEHVCARMADGATYCYGDEPESLGLGYLPVSAVAAPSPVDTQTGGIAGFSAVDTAHLTTCALDTLGAPVCWGDDRYSLVGGTAATDVILSPVRLELGPVEPAAFSQISVAEWSACALSTDGRAFCWGYGWFAQLGRGGEPPWAAGPARVEVYR